MRDWLRPTLIGLSAALIVWMALNLTKLAYFDHDRLNQLWDLELRRAQASQVAPKP